MSFKKLKRYCITVSPSNMDGIIYKCLASSEPDAIDKAYQAFKSVAPEKERYKAVHVTVPSVGMN
jgi:hypothetical protein